MADPAKFPLNLTLMRSPANWIIIGLMLLFAILAAHFITSSISKPKET